MLAALASSGRPEAVRRVAPTPSRMLKNLRVSEPEGQFDLQIASGNACWSPWRQVGAPGQCAGRPGRPSIMLKQPRASEPEGQRDLQIESETHVGCLGVKWAARLIEPRGKPVQGPAEALEHIVRPLPQSVAHIGSGDHSGNLPL